MRDFDAMEKADSDGGKPRFTYKNDINIKFNNVNLVWVCVLSNMWGSCQHDATRARDHQPFSGAVHSLCDAFIRSAKKLLYTFCCSILYSFEFLSLLAFSQIPLTLGLYYDFFPSVSSFRPDLLRVYLSIFSYSPSSHSPKHTLSTQLYCSTVCFRVLFRLSHVSSWLRRQYR